jgi:hypothetical protein
VGNILIFYAPIFKSKNFEKNSHMKKLMALYDGFVFIVIGRTIKSLYAGEVDRHVFLTATASFASTY